MNQVIEYCKQIKKYNYGLKRIIKKYSKEEIFDAICLKYHSMQNCVAYKGRYSWLKLYEDEIKFLIDYIKELTNE